MKTMKMALMAGAAIAVSAVAAHADELSDLKAQVESLNARMAAMETAPSVTAGYQLLAISKGDALQVPGMLGSDRDNVQQNKATLITVMPTADAPAGTTISWSGYVRSAIVYSGANYSASLKNKYDGVVYNKSKGSYDSNDDWDVKARGQLRVVATTDTAVGAVGVELKLRADFNGNGTSNVYMKTAWGYWAMTPELTLGGGYAGSLGNIGYGYDGACTCYYTDNADVGFDPGDTTQMRLTYASGPLSFAMAIEDAGKNDGTGEDNKNAYVSGNNLGAAGEIKYSGDSFSGEISGVYRSTNNEKLLGNDNADSLWQVGAGVGFNLGSIASLSLAGAFGAGPYTTVNDSGDITNNFPVYNQWWGLSGLASANLSDTVHAEAGLGYKHREGDNFSVKTYDKSDPPKNVGNWNYNGFGYDTWAVLGGLYYNPVDQLTIGIEGEWYTQTWDFKRTGAPGANGDVLRGQQDKLSLTNDNWTVDLVSVWRF